MGKRFNVTKTKIIPTAAGVKPHSEKDDPETPEEKEEMCRIPYRETVWALMWAATRTRTDLSFAAHNLAKFCDDPEPVHWEGVVKAPRYFWQIKGLGITYGGVTSRYVTMSAYLDSDHEICPDSRHSVSGGAFILID